MPGDASPFLYVDRPEEFETVVRSMERSHSIGIDTESDSMHCYFEKVCLIQVSTPDAAFIVDPLKLNGQVQGLGPVLGNPGVRTILHGSDYDIVCLKRDFGFRIENLFDTMVAAQFLDLPRIGLADLVEEFFGDHLAKLHSRTNWGRRPLTESEIEYSWLDVKYLIELADRLTERLREADLVEEVEIEFRRLQDREPAPREFDPDGYRRIRGSKGLEPAVLSVLRELHAMRDRQAQRMDRPPFKVLANDTLLRIAREKPETRAELRGIKGVTGYVQRRHGDQHRRAVAKGLKRGRPPAPKRKGGGSTRLSPAQQRRMEALKDWRKAMSERRKLPTLAILPNHAILEIVTVRPRDIEALGALTTVGPKRAGLYGHEILAITR